MKDSEAVITLVLIPIDVYDMDNVCTSLGACVASQAFGKVEQIPPPDAGDHRFETTQLDRWKPRERAELEDIITTGHLTRVARHAQAP